VRRGEHGNSCLAPFTSLPDVGQLLGELNYAAYQELGCDRFLLVEGPKDVPVSQQLLRIYGKDKQFLIWPLLGREGVYGDAEPWLRELKRTSPNRFAIVDSERESECASPAANVTAFKEVCDRLEIPCHVLTRRAIEKPTVQPGGRRSDPSHANSAPIHTGGCSTGDAGAAA
jgi:hypothetical protein